MVVEDRKLQIFGNNIVPSKVTLPPVPARYLQVEFLGLDHADDSIPSVHAQASTHLPFAITQAYQMRIKNAKNLVSDEEDSKRIIELTLDASAISNEFFPGDTIGILPENGDEDVETILNALHLENKADEILKISLCPQSAKKTAKIPPYIPLSSTPRIILKQCLNIHSIPKKLFLRSLLECTDDDEEKNLLKVLCSKEGTEFYSKTVAEGNLTFVKLLEMFPTCHPDFGILLEHLPRLLPRPYSIASSPLEFNNAIKIIFSVLETNPGVTTNFLQKLTNKFLEKSNTQLYVNYYLRKHNQFRYTEDDMTRNIIMISVGCGISPFLGFMEHRDKLCKNTKYSYLGDTWLFTGYRYRNSSLYANQVDDYLRKGVITEYFKSYSRESEWKYKYVQDHIVENSERFVNMIFKENSLIYVCADGASISKDIQESIRKVIATVFQCSTEEAKNMFVQLQKEGKYREDIWT